MRRGSAGAVFVLAAAAAGLTAAQDDRQAIQRMVASERAFAAATAEIGTRDGFLTFFAPDAIELVLAGESGADASTTSATDSLRARPLATLPLSARLMWEPITGHVSADGTLGWLTGPYVTLEERTTTILGQGAYFSIWKRQADGTWRVWFDHGVSFPTPWRPERDFRAAPDPDAGAVGTAGEALAAVEDEVAGGAGPWADRLASGVRLHRDGRMPFEGRDAVLSWSDETWEQIRYTVARIETAESGDLAFVFGGYDGRTSTGPERGLWVRAWKRDVTDRWRVVFELSRPVS
jgi:ketosteroid isomerase-like protein